MYLILILKSPLPIMSFIRISVLRSNGNYYFCRLAWVFFIKIKVYWVYEKEANLLIINKVRSTTHNSWIPALLLFSYSKHFSLW